MGTRLVRRIGLWPSAILLLFAVLALLGQRIGLQDAWLRNLLNHVWLTSVVGVAPISVMDKDEVRYWRRAVSGENGNPALYLSLGRIRVLDQDYSSASEAFKQGASATRSSTRLQLTSLWVLGRGQAYLDEKSYEAAGQLTIFLADLALAEPRYALPCNSRPTELSLARAWSFGHEGDLLAEEKAYQLVMALTPRCADAYYRLGGLYYNQQRYEQAAKVYVQGIAVDTRAVVCGYGYLAGTYLAQGRLDEAAHTAETALPHGGGSQANLVLGRVSQLKGDLFLAQDYYERATEQASRCGQDDWARWTAYFNLGWMAFDRNEYELALFDMRVASQVMSGTAAEPQAVKYVGDMYRRRDMLQEAIQEYEKALKLAPPGWEWVWNIHLALADAYRDSGRGDEAIREYKVVMGFTPQNEAVRRELDKLEPER